MKHFLVEITYTASPEAVAAARPGHRAHLQTGYDSGMLLFSGPQTPPVGGLVLARAASLEAVQAFFAQDPFQTSGVATYRFLEFNPVLHQAFLTDWVSGN